MSDLDHTLGSNPLQSMDRVVITCVTFETAKVVKPIRFLKADKAYLIYHVVESFTDKSSIYHKFHEEVAAQLHEDPGLVDGVSLMHIKDARVFRFQELLGRLIPILKFEKDRGSEVFINISAGSSEFAAAATVAAMMVPGTKAFTVAVSDYMVKGDKIKEVFFEGERPIGQARDVYDPRLLPTFTIEQPPEDLVRGLRVLNQMITAKTLLSYADVIENLKAGGERIWLMTPEERVKWEQKKKEQKELSEKGKKRSARTATQPEKMRYLRHYLQGWESHGWIVRTGRSGRDVKLTPEGSNVLEMFYNEPQERHRDGK